MFISVVTTVRNEARNIAALLDSLVVQEPPLEVIVVDSRSEDATRDIVRDYEKRYDFVRLYILGGTRGAGRNFGIRKAKGEAVAFIDGDAIANPFWLKEIRQGLQRYDIAAGRTIQIGYRPFEDLERVELIVGGTDVTYPSSNLAYRKSVLEEVGGFDEWFVTAEDIDLNIRAVTAGHPITFRAGAIVYHRTRDSIYDFLRQALWNGAGRKQLTLKHGALWSRYRPGQMLRRKTTFWSTLRLSSALLGYLGYKFFGKPLPPERKPLLRAAPNGAGAPEVSVVIPTMNEEASIGAVLDEVRSALAGWEFEVLIVDTDSRDRTRDIATAKGARVVSEPRRGYGRAYRTGFAASRGTYVVTLDADLTYPAGRLPDFLAPLVEDRADFISGDRLSGLSWDAMTGMHRIGNRILNIAFRGLYRSPVRDSQSGMWAFRRAILPHLTLVHGGMAFSEELKLEVIRAGFRFLEIPIDYRARVGEKKIRSVSDATENLVWLARKRVGWVPRTR